MFLITFIFAVIFSINTWSQTQYVQSTQGESDENQSFIKKTTLNYYQQVMGPTLGGQGGETYNVFQEARSPYQSFHAANLRYQWNKNWFTGVSLAAVNSYGDTLTNQQTGQKSQLLVRDEFFNARLFLGLPEFKTTPGTLFTTISYEAPTSVFSRTNHMKYGAVLSQSFAFNLPSPYWSFGFMWQYYRMFYEQNVVPPSPGYLSLARQTTVVSGGPYLGYRPNDRWGINSTVIVDWDQRGLQTGTFSFNNNLPDRMRLGVTYYPVHLKQLTSVGFFTQALINYTAATQIFGGEFSLRF